MKTYGKYVFDAPGNMREYRAQFVNPARNATSKIAKRSMRKLGHLKKMAGYTHNGTLWQSNPSKDGNGTTFNHSTTHK